jgi:hypothetical protein|tara:strand:+ start:257 stop:658 length:402 start_codon:yes stop_codon:yes gene_type:complete
MKIYQKLFKLQQEIGAISKDSKNPFFKSSYFDINQLVDKLLPLLKENKLLLLQPIVKNEVYAIIQDTESDGRVVSSIPLPEIHDPQKIGGAITYYRRYALVSLLGLQADDDDGNTATGKINQKVNQKSNQFKL